MAHQLKGFVESTAHQSSRHSRVKEVLPLHYYIKIILQLPPRTTEVANPAKKLFQPSYFPLTCSIKHS